MNDGLEFDAVVIGAGQGGTPLAQEFAKHGWKTALIEKEAIGGTCINRGCTPTKTMVASARIAYLCRRAQDYGVNTGEISIDLTKIRERKRNIVHDFRSGIEKRIDNTPNLTFFEGTASFFSPTVIEVKIQSSSKIIKLNSKQIFINTGARPSILEIEGLDQIPYLDSTSIMELDSVPEHLVILGGGYIGLEFGQMFRRFGSKVTIIQRADQLLTREDPDISQEIDHILQEDGVQIFYNASAIKIENEANGSFGLSVHNTISNNDSIISGTHLLIASGRTPNSDELNLDAANVRTDSKGYILTNEKLETSSQGIYALGDVKGGPSFTHIAYDDFRILRTNLLENGHVTITNRLVPYTLFTDPQLGRIGLSEKEALNLNLDFKVAKMPMNYVARALEVAESRGIMKVIVDRQTSQILGAAVLGIEGGEIMSMIQIAMIGKLPYTILKDAVFAHPNLSESLNNLFAYI